MTVAPSPYAILQAIQDQQRATARLIAMLAGMLDKSAPDPLMNWSPPRAAVEPPPRKVVVGETWAPREKPRSNRPMRRIEIGGVPVLMSEARAGMVDALREKPCTTEDIVALGLSVSMDAVRKSFGCMNVEFEKLGIRHRIKPIERLSRVGPKGGSILPRYALVDPEAEIVAPHFPTAAQSEAAAGVSPEEGASASAEGSDDVIVAAHDAQFAMPAGEGGTSCVEPSPAADAKTRPQIGAFVGVDRVLDMWRDTELSKLDIARQIGISRTTVVNILADARERLEPRVIAGDTVRMTAKEAASIQRSDDPPPSVVPASPPAASTRPLAGPSEGKPVSIKGGDTFTITGKVGTFVVAPPTPAVKARQREAGRAIAALLPTNAGSIPIEPGDLLAVDIKAKRVQTARGAYEVGGVNLARALEMMKGGQLFGLDVIAKRAGWPNADVAKTALGFERNRLAQHGIDLFLDKFNARLREAA